MCADRTGRKAERDEVTDEELDAQDAERLPDREVMSIVDPDVGRLPPVDVDDPNTYDLVGGHPRVPPA
jgi:hypothetical protein